MYPHEADFKGGFEFDSNGSKITVQIGNARINNLRSGSEQN